MQIEFHGAAGGVTGSCYLLEVAGQKLLIDCGLYQGGREIEEENAKPFGFDPTEIDYVLLTHAHLDHCGRLPLLVKQGFRGEIITTGASRDLAKIILMDSANLAEEEARRKTYQARKAGRKEPIEPLYSVLDALDTLDFFGRRMEYNRPTWIAEGIRATFIDAGHILGSAAILLDLQESGRRRKVLFSGDLGNRGKPILRDPAPPPHADVVVMETTYGNRPHKPLAPSVTELYEAILDTLDRGGNVIIPTFALERAQELLYFLREGIESKILPRHLPVFLDSPMAISATEIFRRHPECYDREANEIFHSGRDPLDLPNLYFTRETAESMRLNQIDSGAVILAGSGMCTGGRVRHHLKHNLWRPECSIVFVGFAARGTLARIIIDGAQTVRLFGREIQVRAKRYTIGGFSAHADCHELADWHRQTGRPELTFLVHGEDEARNAMAGRLDGRVELPDLHSRYSL
ncbi:MAG: MBL fold metallo-hydrolase [Methylohalobius sp. ZOD2]|nr:MBL fold metallo-hydrolase [Methylothermaceae bacterium]